MIRMTLSVKTVRNEIGELSRRAQKKAKTLIFEDSHVTVADAKARSRVDTGAMRDGWQAPMVNPYIYELKNDVPHTVFNELGTTRMAAQPMAAPAVESARQRLPRKLGEAFRR